MSLKLRHQSPPRRIPRPSVPAPSPEIAISERAKPKKDGFAWGKLALGTGLALTTLTACGTPTQPATDPGTYEIESPEVVVLSDSIQRIDISRETREDCTGFGEEETCTTVDVKYHDVGLHVGEGVVQDLNGNLFAAPQLVADAPGIAVANPDSLDAKGSLWQDGSIRRQADGNYEVRGDMFGKRDIEVTENGLHVTSAGLFGGDITSATNENGVTTIKEGRTTVALVQSQGDHLLVQTRYGRELAEIRHEDGSNEYSVSKPGGFGRTTTMRYNGNEITRKNGRWNGNATIRDGDGVYKEKSGRSTVLTTEFNENGWKDDHGFLDSGIQYTFEGGQVLPG